MDTEKARKLKQGKFLKNTGLYVVFTACQVFHLQ